MARLTWSAGLLAVAILAAAGCEKRVHLTGRVLQDGRPVPGAELSGIGESNPAVAVAGLTGPDGTFSLESGGRPDIPVGKYRILVTWWRTADSRSLPEGEEGAALKDAEAVRQYTARLEIDVTGDTRTLDLDVSGRAVLVGGD